MRRTLILLTAALLLAAACSSSDDDAATTSSSTTSTSSTSTSTTSSTTSTTTAPPKVCSASPPATPPQGSVSGPIPDIDGDGSADTGFVDETAGSRRIGVVTAAGASSTVEVPSASPIPLSLFVADADHSGGPEVLASDGRMAQLFTYADCKLAPVLNRQGKTYSFDLGFGENGTGVGCATIAGKPSLVGLKAASDDGTTVKWTRTVIELDGTHASNGPTDSGTFTRPADDHAIDLLHTISCGDRTIADDGIHDNP